jgi:hypothetical protein
MAQGHISLSPLHVPTRLEEGSSPVTRILKESSREETHAQKESKRRPEKRMPEDALGPSPDELTPSA